MKKLSIFLLILIVLPISSCYFNYGRVSSQAMPLKASFYKALPIDSVNIFLQPQDLPTHFDKVAMIYSGYVEIHPWRDARKWHKMWQQVRQQAAKLGCNGVYQWQDASKFNSPTVVYDSLQRVTVTQSFRREKIFIAIKY
ncbi:MAG: hypothetical protein EAZ95_19645 [Bacteroidetes bacterium]|nr:MAG: hypothetical protein EAZ95_19645 [Bacteroidota bacterium]